MKNSERYKQLLRGARLLRKALLPCRFDPTGNYRLRDSVHLRTVSFRILIHAELESFIEDRALELFEAAWKAWQEGRVPNQVVIGLLAFSGSAMCSPPTKLGGDPAKQNGYEDIHKPVQKAQSIWRATHKENHGVKEANILALLLPLGINATDLAPTLLADLTSYGCDRGAVAHRSSLRVTQYCDPKEEWQRATQLLQDVGKLDQLVREQLVQIGALRKALT